MIRALRRRADRAPDSGLGMVELLVASIISLLTLALVGTLFVQVTRLAANGQSTKAATGTASTVMNEIAGVVRQATRVPTSLTAAEGGVIAGSSDTTLSVDSLDRASIAPGQANVAPSRVAFTVDGSGNLVEQRIPGVLSGSYYGFGGTATSRVVGGPILTTGTGTGALFVYYSGTGSTLTRIVPAAGGLTDAQAAQVTTVGVNVVSANRVSTGSDPVQVSNLITMPNVAILNGGN